MSSECAGYEENGCWYCPAWDDWLETSYRCSVCTPIETPDTPTLIAAMRRAVGGWMRGKPVGPMIYCSPPPGTKYTHQVITFGKGGPEQLREQVAAPTEYIDGVKG